jgi:hypothetical protein
LRFHHKEDLTKFGYLKILKKRPSFFWLLVSRQKRYLKSIKKGWGIIPTNKRILRQQIWICVTNLKKQNLHQKKAGGLWEDVFLLWVF